MLPEVLATIPHRPPFLFIDEIKEVRADGAICTGAVYLTRKLQAEGSAPDGKTPVLCRIEEAKFKGMVKPGDTVVIEVKHVETLQQFHFLTGTVRRDGKAVLTLRFALALVDQPA